jgi:hypothetical protein
VQMRAGKYTQECIDDARLIESTDRCVAMLTSCNDKHDRTARIGEGGTRKVTLFNDVMIIIVADVYAWQIFVIRHCGKQLLCF